MKEPLFSGWFFNRDVAVKDVKTAMIDDGQIPTRASLLERLKDAGDATSWNEFHLIYRGLLYSVARRAGLNETESADS